MPSQGHRHKTLIVYQHLPHYRLGIFRALQSDPRLQVHFASDGESADGSIPTLTTDHLHDIHPVQNVWLRGYLWQRGLLRLVGCRGWDHIIFLGDAHYLSTWVAAVLARAKGTRVSFWTIGWHGPESGPKRYFRIGFYYLAHELLLYGDYPKAFGASLGFPQDRMKVIYNSSSGPADVGLPPTQDPVAMPSTAPQLVGAVIRLNPIKRLDLLIRAVALLRAEGRDVVVEILGEGPARADLERLAAVLRVPLSLPGAVYERDAISEFYGRLSVCVVPSFAGLSVIQSMRHGRPVITHGNMTMQVPECEAIDPGRTGDVYVEGSEDDLATKIGDWLDIQREHSVAIATACHEEVSRRWTPEAQRAAILRAVGIDGVAPSDVQPVQKDEQS